MKPKYTYHTNPNWRRCLEIVNEAQHGVSTFMVYKRGKFDSVRQTYGYLYRLQEAGLVKGDWGIWKPIYDEE